MFVMPVALRPDLQKCRFTTRPSAKVTFGVLHLGDSVIGLHVSEIALVSRLSAFGRDPRPGGNEAFRASPKLGGCGLAKLAQGPEAQPLVSTIVVVRKEDVFNSTVALNGAGRATTWCPPTKGSRILSPGGSSASMAAGHITPSSDRSARPARWGTKLPPSSGGGIR